VRALAGLELELVNSIPILLETRKKFFVETRLVLREEKIQEIKLIVTFLKHQWNSFPLSWSFIEFKLTVSANSKSETAEHTAVAVTVVIGIPCI
jgi:hypothetical protein